MRYMMLIYTNEGESITAEEYARVASLHGALMAEATQRGILHGADPLMPTAMAKTVRHQNGKALVTDGPFAETKEQLAGYYLLDCADLEEAIEWARRIPTA